MLHHSETSDGPQFGTTAGDIMVKKMFDHPGPDSAQDQARPSSHDKKDKTFFTAMREHASSKHKIVLLVGAVIAVILMIITGMMVVTRKKAK